MDPTKLHGKFPWITKEGYFDPGKFPIDSALKQALSDNEQEFRSGLNRRYEVSVKLVEATEKLRETAESPEKRLDRAEVIP